MLEFQSNCLESNHNWKSAVFQMWFCVVLFSVTPTFRAKIFLSWRLWQQVPLELRLYGIPYQKTVVVFILIGMRTSHFINDYFLLYSMNWVGRERERGKGSVILMGPSFIHTSKWLIFCTSKYVSLQHFVCRKSISNLRLK